MRLDAFPEEVRARMRRTATLLLIAVCGAVLLLIAAAGSAGKPAHAGMASSAQVTGGFAALIALTVFAAAMAEYLIHGRKIFLSLAAGFLAAGLIDAWCAMLPARDAGQAAVLWYAGRLTLAALLLYGALAARTQTPRPQNRVRAVVYLTGTVLWVAVVLFSVPEFSLGKLLGGEDALRITALASVLLFALAWLAYSRPAVQRNSTLLAWISYGLIFAFFAQLSAVLRTGSGAREAARMHRRAIGRAAGGSRPAVCNRLHHRPEQALPAPGRYHRRVLQVRRRLPDAVRPEQEHTPRRGGGRSR